MPQTMAGDANGEVEIPSIRWIGANGVATQGKKMA
jgi:hypothetical protein